ncbi:hypothetical protein COCCADRAFT_112770, partial [Bipolaris zeicola 26-R-13]
KVGYLSFLFSRAEASSLDSHWMVKTSFIIRQGAYYTPLSNLLQIQPSLAWCSRSLCGLC